MATLDRLELYLRAQLASMRTPAEVAVQPAIRPFVTISRQAGAGGHSLAGAMLERFSAQADKELFGDWQVFDQKLCRMVAEDPMFTQSLDSLLAEEYRRPANDLFHQVLRSTVDQDLVMTHVFQMVHALASVGKAIIVGRGASQVTRGMSPGVRLRVVAPDEQRITRLMELLDLSERRAKAEMRKVDTGRARLVRSHFGVDIDDPLEYDAVWNTGGATLEEIADATISLLQCRVAATRPA